MEGERERRERERRRSLKPAGFQRLGLRAAPRVNLQTTVFILRLCSRSERERERMEREGRGGGLPPTPSAPPSPTPDIKGAPELLEQSF